MFCQKCGNEQPDDSQYCSKCGTTLSTISESDPNATVLAGNVEKNAILMGRYKIIKKLGQGGFGATYLAHHEGFDEKVVVKELVQVSKKGRELFNREVTALRKLNIAGVPRVIDSFSEGESQYLVQDYIDGISLREYLNKLPDKRLNLEKARHITIEMLKILNQVHQQDLIHRDIKPDNIMIIDKNDKLEVFLIDFGGVKEQNIVSKQEFATQLITPGYTAPEQAVGKTKKESDYFSLGMTLVEATTGIKASELPEDSANIELGKYGVTDKKLTEVIEKMIDPNIKKRLSDTATAFKILQVNDSSVIYSQKINDNKKFLQRFFTKKKLIALLSIPVIFLLIILWTFLQVTVFPEIKKSYANYRIASVQEQYSEKEKGKIEVNRKKCYSGDLKSCKKLIKIDQDGEEKNIDFSKSFKLFQKFCSKGDMSGCVNLGYMYENGKGVEQNFSKAVILYNTACNNDKMSGCKSLGHMYEDGKAGKKDIKKALQLYSKSCDKGYMDGCASLGGIYFNGDVVEKDYLKAVNYAQKACYGGNKRGCGLLGFIYEHGAGVDQDYSKAIILYSKACVKGKMSACSYLGDMHKDGKGTKKDYLEAIILYSKACFAGNMPGCFSLGEMYEKGMGVEKSESQAIEYYLNACDNFLYIGCFSLGWIYSNEDSSSKNYKKAIQYYQKACTNNIMRACNNLAVQYENGRGVRQNIKIAKSLYKKACEGKVELGCNSLGRIYDGQNNSKLAKFYFGKACDLGYEEGCKNYKKINEQGYLYNE